MPDQKRVIRVDLSEEEAVLVIKSINLGNTMLMGDVQGQIETAVGLKQFMYDPNAEGRLKRLNDFREKFARLVFGEEMIDQMVKDLESEAIAKGWERCSDCGRYHA